MINKNYVRKTSIISDIDFSNDYDEGNVVFQQVEHALAHKGVNSSKIAHIIDTLKFICDPWQSQSLKLAFCLSKQSDLLSQWRGYANDGKGIAIGFNTKFLESIKISNSTIASPKLSKVRYASPKSSIEGSLKFLIHYLSNLVDSDNLDLSEVLIDQLLLEFSQHDHNEELVKSIHQITDEIFETKHIAFHEEQEWRLHGSYPHMLIQQEKLIKTSVASSAIKSHLSIPIRPNEAIKEIILGPKNSTKFYSIDSFLGMNDYFGVNILRSNTPYR